MTKQALQVNSEFMTEKLVDELELKMKRAKQATYQRTYIERQREKLSQETLGGYHFANHSLGKYQQQINQSLANLLIMLDGGRSQFKDKTLDRASELIGLLDTIKKGLDKDLLKCQAYLKKLEK